MKKRKSIIFEIGLLLFFCLVIVSCSEGDFTIFYQVVNEKMISDTNLENTLSIHGMAEMTLGSGNRYYVAASAIFTRLINSNDWDKISYTTNNSEVMCDSMVEFNNDLFVTFYSRNGENFGLYYVDNADLSANPKRDATWNEVNIIGVPANSQFAIIKEDGTNMFVSAYDKGVISDATDDTYYILSTNNGSNYTVIDIDLSQVLSSPIRDVTTVGANYWYIDGTNIYVGNATSASTLTGPPDPPTVSGSERYEGIIATTNGNIYVSTSKGNIWFYNGATWTSEHFTYNTSSDPTENVWFTKFIEVTPEPDLILVGTRGAGFYEIDETAGLGNIQRFGNTSKRELYDGSVENFYLASNDDIFVLTMGTGLWRSRRSSGEWDSWTWE